jgi:ribosomal protein S18 acetylase RimI-like enzyme
VANPQRTRIGSFGAVEIVDVREAELETLRPAWLALHHHHLEVASFEGLLKDDDASWAARRAMYAAGDVEVFAARDGDRLLGYAALRYGLGADDTFMAPAGHAELLTLSVMPGERGRGVGSALLDEVDRRLRARGPLALAVAVMTGNEDALRLYRRRGLVPAETILWRMP